MIIGLLCVDRLRSLTRRRHQACPIHKCDISKL